MRAPVVAGDLVRVDESERVWRVVRVTPVERYEVLVGWPPDGSQVRETRWVSSDDVEVFVDESQVH